MSRTDKDRGHHHSYACMDTKGHAWFTKQCRRRRRRIETNQMRHGIQPTEKNQVQYDYYD
jgi:hypothetical protein